MRFVQRVLLVGTLFVLTALGISQGPAAVAQDATPAGDCPATTPDENVAIVTAYLIAFEAQDDAAIDAALADDYADNVDRYTAPVDDTTNQDEVSLAHALEQYYPGSAYSIVDIFGAGDKVAVTVNFTVTGHMLTGELVMLETPLEVEGISIFTIECGMIASGYGVSNQFELLTGVGAIPPLEMGPAATPEP